MTTPPPSLLLVLLLVDRNLNKLVSVLLLLFLISLIRSSKELDYIRFVQHLQDCMRQEFTLKLSHFQIIRDQRNFESCVDVRSRACIREEAD